MEIAWSNYLRRESGYSWCETNYQVTPTIAEFANTVSSLPILVFPLINWALTRHYSSGYVMFMHAQIALVGLASVYYHATLSLFGQLVDELAILWVVVSVFCHWLPIMRSMPPRIKLHLTEIRMCVCLCALAASTLAFLRPHLNSLALITLATPILALIILEANACDIAQVNECGYAATITFLVSLGFWFLDRLFCDLWMSIKFPYLHAIFHLLASHAVHSGFVMFLFLEISRTAPHLSPQLRRFPRQWQQFGFPYITLQKPN